MAASIRGVLIDLSGTVHIGDKPMEGAVHGIQLLRQLGIPVFTSLTAARQLVEQGQLRPLLLLEREAMTDFEGIETRDPNAVVVGLSPSRFDYEHLNKAFRLLLEGAPLIAVHKGKYFAEKEKSLSLGPGAFVTGLEYAADVKALVVGKPSKTFYEAVLKDINCLEQSNKVVVIGDDVQSDLGEGAKELGLIRWLVKTGKYREGDEKKHLGVDGVYDHLGEALDRISQLV